MKYAGLSIILVLVFVAGGVSLESPESALERPLRPPSKIPKVAQPAPRSGAGLISFESASVRILNPDGNVTVRLPWHAVAKGDFGSCVVTVATFFSNADGSVTRTVDWDEAQPKLPYVLPGRAGGGVIRLDTEKAIHKSIKVVADLPDSPGVDRLTVVLTLVGTKGGRITTQDSDVVTFILPP